MTDLSADIAVVGAGLVGVPLAMTLAARGWDVVLLDQAAGGVPGSGDQALDQPLDERCVALSASSVEWLDREGLWSPLAARANPIDTVQVSEQGSFGVTRLKAREFGLAALGQVVAIDEVLDAWAPLLAASRVRHEGGFRAAGFRRPGVVFADSEDKPDVAARLVIAVDGVGSRLREAAGIATRQTDYGQAGILANIQLEYEHDNTAFERFTPGGPLALLPRPGRRMNIVHSVPREEADALMSLDEGGYLDQLQARFGYRLGRFAAIGSRHQVPLVRIEATRQVAERTLLLGNAARLLHPVAGQGYNLALRDVAACVQALGSAEDGRTDPGRTEFLGRFVASRERDQRRTVRLSDTLARSFRGNASVLRHLRSLGLLGLDLVDPLRNEFARQAMGFVVSGASPRN